MTRQDLSTVQAMETAFTMQLEFIHVINNLIAYDREHADVPEKTKYLQGFCDTQERALDMALCLLNKHKDALLEIEKARKAEEEKKRREEQEKRNAENKKKREKEAVKKDLKKAQEEETSLFAGLGLATEGDGHEENS